MYDGPDSDESSTSPPLSPSYRMDLTDFQMPKITEKRKGEIALWFLRESFQLLQKEDPLDEENIPGTVKSFMEACKAFNFSSSDIKPSELEEFLRETITKATCTT